MPGPPKGKGRHRFTQSGHAYTPKETVEYEKKVAFCYKQQCGNAFFEDHIPLDMRITAYFQIPKSVSKKKRQAMIDHLIRPTLKPDSSNVMKAIEDGLNKVAYSDDAQIVDSQVRRFYSDNPRVVVTIQEATCI